MIGLCRVTKEKYFGDVFRQQAEAMARAGYHELARMGESEFLGLIEELQSLLSGIMVKPRQDIIPFLIVIPNALVPVAWQWMAFEYKDKRAVPRNATEVYRPQVNNLPRDYPYLVTLVDDGAQYCGDTALNIAAKAQESGRNPLMAEEGMALLRLKPSLLHAQYVCCGNTRCGPDGRRVPFFRYGVEEYVLDSLPETEAGEDYAFPTCHSRLYFKPELDHPWDGPS